MSSHVCVWSAVLLRVWQQRRLRRETCIVLTHLYDACHFQARQGQGRAGSAARRLLLLMRGDAGWHDGVVHKILPRQQREVGQDKFGADPCHEARCVPVPSMPIMLRFSQLVCALRGKGFTNCDGVRRGGENCAHMGGEAKRSRYVRAGSTPQPESSAVRSKLAPEELPFKYGSAGSR